MAADSSTSKRFACAAATRSVVAFRPFAAPAVTVTTCFWKTGAAGSFAAVRFATIW